MSHVLVKGGGGGLNRKYVYYCRISKICNEVGRMDNFRALARKSPFLPTELDIRYF